MIEDRRVHATNGVRELVRYDRAGAWYVECDPLPRRRVTIDEAVKQALTFGWTPILGIPGGTTFDRRVRDAQA